MTLNLDQPWIYYHDEYFDRHMVLVRDYEWYLANQYDIESWMILNLSKGCDSMNGMVIKFADQRELLLWTMRWS